MSGPSTQQLPERRHHDNPILQIEETRRFPLRGARVPPARTAFVFRSRGGRLSNPRGGYTAGEMLWRGPRVIYQVDLVAHPLRLSWDLGGGTGESRTVAEVSGRWTVEDPEAVVAYRVASAQAICLAAIRDALGDLPPISPAAADRLQSVLRARLPDSLHLAEGIRLEHLSLRLALQPGRDAAGLVRELLTVDEDPAGAGDDKLAENWALDRELAGSALAAADDGDWSGDETARVHAMKAALQRFADLTERLGAHVQERSRRDDGGDR